MTAQEFQRIYSEKEKYHPEDLTAQFYLDILIHHLLGKNWYSMSGWTSAVQVDGEAVYEILQKYKEKKTFVRRIIDFLERFDN